MLTMLRWPLSILKTIVSAKSTIASKMMSSFSELSWPRLKKCVSDKSKALEKLI